MNPILFTLYHDIAIHIYGVCIVLGILAALALMNHDIKEQSFGFSLDLIINSISWIAFGGYLGGRILFLVSEETTVDDLWLLLEFWQPGLSILGCVIGVALSLITYATYKKIPVLKFTDHIATYTALIQSFGRLGCFFTGCCYGLPCHSFWAITYHHAHHMAPLNIALHPTQLYSSFLLFCIFLLNRQWLSKKNLPAGFITCIYLILTSLERFIVDFWRWDQTFFASSSFKIFSINQWTALMIIAISSLGCIILYHTSKKKN